MDCAEFEERWLEALDRGGGGDPLRRAARAARGGAGEGEAAGGASREDAACEGAGAGEAAGDAAHRDADAEAERLVAHLAACRRCRDFAALTVGRTVTIPGGCPEGMAETAGLEAIEPPDDLIAAVMARTSGSACARAGRLLAERLDPGHDDGGGLDPLLHGHLEGCGRCSTLARVLEAMGPELAAMAEVEPDPGFVADVMAATASAGSGGPAMSPTSPPRPSSPPLPASPPPGLRDRLAAIADPSGAWGWLVLSIARSASWNRLVRRPRLALEGAFVASVAVVLLFGVPVESVSDVPTRVLAKARQERIEATDGLRRLTAANLEWLATVAENRWSRVRSRIDPWLDVARSAEIPGPSATGDMGEARAGPAPRDGDRNPWPRWKGRLLRVFDEIWSYFEAFIERIGVASGDIADDA